MSTGNKIFVSCEDANHICDKSQYKESSFWEKVKLNIHLIYCKACRKYTAKNTKLTKLFKDPNVVSIDKSAKDAMKEQLKKKMSEQN
ncbi:glycine dehydrogenase [Aquimarina sp. SS2-1]|uniref:glycine dehydrogenase n=1 Tax=Aquimarina besae TaxID=3342247 RepID=UPI00366B5034